MPSDAAPTTKPTISVSLPAWLVAAVDVAAEERMVGRSWLVEKLLTIGLNGLPPVPDLGGPPAAPNATTPAERSAQAAS